MIDRVKNIVKNNYTQKSSILTYKKTSLLISIKDFKVFIILICVSLMISILYFN